MMKENPHLLKKALLRLSQGSVYAIGLGNGQRPQAYVNATIAEL